MSFDRLAPHYTWMERVLAGQRLQRCRVTWLDALAGCDDILIAGVGHGHFLRACVQRFPEARITAVDASAGMLRHAAQGAKAVGGHAERLNFVQAKLPEWTPPANAYDAIVTHFFLDCFPAEDLRRVVAALAGAARPRAVWLISDFAVPLHGLARFRAHAVHKLMYAFFRRVTRIAARKLTDPDPYLIARGFRLSGRASANWGLLRADHWRQSTPEPAT